jgi:hypothetical protein
MLRQKNGVTGLHQSGRSRPWSFSTDLPAAQADFGDSALIRTDTPGSLPCLPQATDMR